MHTMKLLVVAMLMGETCSAHAHIVEHLDSLTTEKGKVISK